MPSQGGRPLEPEEAQSARYRERYRELLEELRVVLPGVQVLFAFLLTAPFSARFGDLDEFGRDMYFVALAGAALSSVLFMAPTSYHRIAPRQDRAGRLRVAIRLTMAGLVSLVVAIVAALFVVTRFVFGADEGIAMAAGAILAVALLWYALPLRERIRSRRGADGSADPSAR